MRAPRRITGSSSAVPGRGTDRLVARLSVAVSCGFVVSNAVRPIGLLSLLLLLQHNAHTLLCVDDQDALLG